MRFSELDWVEFLKKRVPKKKNVLLGIGDDCALVALHNKNLLLKSDLFIENIHFKRNNSSLKTIAARAVGRVFSDFAACGGRPLYIGVSLGFPRYFRERELKEILSGVLFMTKKYDCNLVGGDTSKSQFLFLDVWGVGSTSKFISRSGACIGDYIFVTDKLGARSFTKTFEPRVKEAIYLIDNFRINAMIDISDGFVLDMFRILKESKKGALLYRKDIPTTSGEKDFYRGEDYELIFTVPSSESKLSQLQRRFFLVGRITPQELGFRFKEIKGTSKILVKGYQHF